MPIYEYECQSCQQITEARQSLKDAPLTTCTSCQGELSKIISQTSFRLKGGGWYADGYSSTGGPQKSCAAAGECAATGECAASTPAAPPCNNACGC